MNTARAILCVPRGLRAAFALATLLSGSAAEASQEPVDVYFVCRDGQVSEGSSMRCDLDGQPDGRCTFGEEGGKSVRVAAGASARHDTLRNVRGELTCEAATDAAALAAKPRPHRKRIAGSKRPPSGSSCAGTRVLAPRFVYPLR